VFDWRRLEVRKGKSGVVTVRVPRELLELARREAGVAGDGWDAESLARVQRWLVERIGQELSLPVVETPGTSWFRADGEGLLVFLTR
jgi:hypothetical protein